MKENLFEVICLLFHLQHLQNINWNNQLCYWGHQFQYYWKQGYNSHRFFCSCLSIFFIILYIFLESLPQFCSLFCMKIFLCRSWFECSCFSVEDIYFYWCFFLFSTILFFYCFSSQKSFIIDLWPIDSYFSFVLFQPKAGFCLLQNVNSYKMRWKFDPYCCSEIWLSCFSVSFFVFFKQYFVVEGRHTVRLDAFILGLIILFVRLKNAE